MERLFGYVGGFGRGKALSFGGLFLLLTVGVLLGYPPPSGAQNDTVTIPDRLDHPELFTRDAPGDKPVRLVVMFKRKATQAEYDDLGGWLESQGFNLTPGDASDVMIVCTGDVSISEHAFGVQIRTTERPEEWGDIDDPKLPARFGGLVAMIEGLHPTAMRPVGPKPIIPPPTEGPQSSLPSNGFKASPATVNGINAMGLLIFTRSTTFSRCWLEEMAVEPTA